MEDLAKAKSTRIIHFSLFNIHHSLAAKAALRGKALSAQGLLTVAAVSNRAPQGNHPQVKPGSGEAGMTDRTVGLSRFHLHE